MSPLRKGHATATATTHAKLIQRVISPSNPILNVNISLGFGLAEYLVSAGHCKCMLAQLHASIAPGNYFNKLVQFPASSWLCVYPICTFMQYCVPGAVFAMGGHRACFVIN